MALIEPKLSGLRVLLVEDSFLVATSITRLLEDLGCRVVGPFATLDVKPVMIEERPGPNLKEFTRLSREV